MLPREHAKLDIGSGNLERENPLAGDGAALCRALWLDDRGRRGGPPIRNPLVAFSSGPD
jgi:hypothetical protein